MGLEVVGCPRARSGAPSGQLPGKVRPRVMTEEEVEEVEAIIRRLPLLGADVAILSLARSAAVRSANSRLLLRTARSEAESIHGHKTIPMCI